MICRLMQKYFDYVCARHVRVRRSSEVSSPSATTILVNKLVYFARGIILS